MTLPLEAALKALEEKHSQEREAVKKALEEKHREEKKALGRSLTQVLIDDIQRRHEERLKAIKKVFGMGGDEDRNIRPL